MNKQNECRLSGNVIAIDAREGLAPIWMRSVDAARIAWCKLTRDELVQTGGAPGKLSDLIEKRYALSRFESVRQVKEFLTQCGTWS